MKKMQWKMEWTITDTYGRILLALPDLDFEGGHFAALLGSPLSCGRSYETLIEAIIGLNSSGVSMKCILKESFEGIHSMN